MGTSCDSRNFALSGSDAAAPLAAVPPEPVHSFLIEVASQRPHRDLKDYEKRII